MLIWRNKKQKKAPVKNMVTDIAVPCPLASMVPAVN